MTKEDKRRKTDRKGGRVGEGGTTGRGRPQQARWPMYPAVIRRGVLFALASKTGGRGRGIFFFCSKSTNYCVSQCSWLREVGVSLKGNELVNCAPNGRPRTSQNVGERGRGSRGTDTAAPDGPKWTAQSDDQWWWLEESEM